MGKELNPSVWFECFHCGASGIVFAALVAGVLKDETSLQSQSFFSDSLNSSASIFLYFSYEAHYVVSCMDSMNKSSSSSSYPLHSRARSHNHQNWRRAKKYLMHRVKKKKIKFHFLNAIMNEILVFWTHSVDILQSMWTGSRCSWWAAKKQTNHKQQQLWY